MVAIRWQSGGGTGQRVGQPDGGGMHEQHNCWRMSCSPPSAFPLPPHPSSPLQVNRKRKAAAVPAAAAKKAKPAAAAKPAKAGAAAAAAAAGAKRAKAGAKAAGAENEAPGGDTLVLSTKL